MAAQDVMVSTTTPQNLRIEQQWAHTLPPETLVPRRLPQPSAFGGPNPNYPQGHPQAYGPGYNTGYPAGPWQQGQPANPWLYYPQPQASYGSTVYRYEPSGPYQYWRRPGWDFTRPLPSGTYGVARRPVRPLQLPCLEGRPCNE